MNIVRRKPMSLEEFLAWEDRQELRYEFDGFGPVAIADSTLAQALIQANLIRVLGTRLHGGPYRVFGSNLKIATACGIRYPDVFVACPPVQYGATIVTEPIVVFKVLSTGAAVADRIVKNQEYRDTPSIQRYVMLEQDRQAAAVFSRRGLDWVGHVFVGDVALAMPEISVELPLAEIYEDVAFPEPTAET